jgi:transposase-like protein
MRGGHLAILRTRNGYRRREWDTRAGTIELAIPELRHGSYYPEWLLERRRAEQALATVVATSYLQNFPARRLEKRTESLGVTKLSKSQVSVMAAELDKMVTGLPSPPLYAGPYALVWNDAITQKVHEGGRTVNVHALIATGVNADGKREILGPGRGHRRRRQDTGHRVSQPHRLPVEHRYRADNRHARRSQSLTNWVLTGI